MEMMRMNECNTNLIYKNKKKMITINDERQLKDMHNLRAVPFNYK